MTTDQLLATRYPARTARQAAGFSLEAAAAKVRLQPSTLRGYEYRQWFAYGVAKALATLYGCSINCFLPNRPRMKAGGRKLTPRLGRGGTRT